MKAYLISITEGITLAEAEKINLDDLRSSGWNDVLNDRLLSDDYADLDYTAKKLKAKIEAYKQLLMKTSPEVDLSNLKTDQVMVYGELIPWEKSNFEQLPLPLVIYNMIRIELSLQMAETAVLSKIK